MSWEGYFEYDGNVIINVARTEAYMKNAGLGWFRPVYNNEALPLMLGESYNTPMQDDAPWTDPDKPESYSFYGIYPLGVDGIENSPRVSAPVENITDGGSPGRIRNAMKTIVFNAVLFGESDAACDYGMRWLKQVLLGNACTPTFLGCSGATLCYLSADPEADIDPTNPFDVEECLSDYHRSLRQVVFNSGPTLTSKRVTSDGAAVWTVTFSAVAGSPYELGIEVEVISGLLDPGVEVPWAGGEVPEGGYIDDNGYMYPDDDSCAPPPYEPVVDPLCPAVLPPPSAPSVPIGCYDPPTNWRRRQFTIPKQFIPLWGEVVPKVSIHARDDELRNLRLRFYSDPYLTGDISDDPCAYCGDLIVSYVPQDHTLIFDASEQRVLVQAPGGTQVRADSLVFQSDGRPFEWPLLSCGFGYVVTLDLPETQTPPVVDLSLYGRAV